MGENQVAVFGLSLFCSLFYIGLFCHAANTITKGQSMKDGEFLISVDETFELGFFSPENSSLRYLGIRYHKIEDKAVVWVANREKPISDTNGTLTISEDGNLMVLHGKETVVWSSNASIEFNNTAAILQTTGNFILLNSDNIADTSKTFWESFNDPTHTYLPNMRAYSNSAAGENHAFSSWKSASDPSPGNFTMGVDPRGAPQIVIWEQSERRWRSGHWNGLIFTGVPSMALVSNYQYGFKLTLGDGGNNYFTYTPSNTSNLLRFEITWDGYEEQLMWNESTKEWDVIQRQPANDCEKYNYCGNFGVCRISDSPKCSCMEGFEPSNADQWRKGNWTGGCMRRSALQCQSNASVTGESTDGFKVFRGLKLPDFADIMAGVSLEICEEICLKNCSCNAFALISGIGCMTWKGSLIDVQQFDNSGNSLYLRLAESEFDGKRLSSLVIAIIIVAGVAFLAISMWLLWMLKRKLKGLPMTASVSWSKNDEVPLSDVSQTKEYSTDFSGQVDLSIEANQVNAPDLPLFNFNIVAAATDNFSEKNKLGQGGFGPVYKGKLPGGEEIAVKRLSRISGQGLEEFKNEIIMIAKLQHRNLVRLLGCCIQGEEKMLLYEYMPNKSLDCFIFDSANQALLDWSKRLAIIEGIARGLLYLHRDSRLRIIHRDLKASNILLDGDMNPKISDFGMARIFGGNQHEANTIRVVGTYGYMAPEYAMEGLFSVKSDVYSFGVLLLEIVSGRRNTSFRLSDHMSLIAYAWELWNEGRVMDLVDPFIRNSCSQKEVSKCIQVGMLCVQDSALHRPTMASVVLMLESNGPTLPLPRQPTFTSIRASIDTETHMVDGQEIVSSNDLTVTMVVGR